MPWGHGAMDLVTVKSPLWDKEAGLCAPELGFLTRPQGWNPSLSCSGSLSFQDLHGYLYIRFLMGNQETPFNS